MSFLERELVGQHISDVMADTEVTYIMLANGTQITIRGIVVVEPVWPGGAAAPLDAVNIPEHS